MRILLAELLELVLLSLITILFCVGPAFVLVYWCLVVRWRLIAAPMCVTYLFVVLALVESSSHLAHIGVHSLA